MHLIQTKDIRDVDMLDLPIDVCLTTGNGSKEAVPSIGMGCSAQERRRHRKGELSEWRETVGSQNCDEW
jgi:hypothetical protein